MLTCRSVRGRIVQDDLRTVLFAPMAGPDPKRMYIAINSQNLDALKPEKPYWSKPFVFVNPS